MAVCAPAEASDAELLLAGAVGRLLAERGCVLVSGGLGGGMAAACRGAREAGGVTIGIIPGYDDRAANPWVEHVVCTGLGQARNALVAATGQALIAVGGGWGTLSEIALGLRLGRPVVLLGGWAELLVSEEGGVQFPDQEGMIVAAENAEGAVEAAISAISSTESPT
ncbi:MAG: TIGR00725 family protein [Chloroflexi bacterium]|nr:TIGR00725 family protein [Chloroflexota bacterium]